MNTQNNEAKSLIELIHEQNSTEAKLWNITPDPYCDQCSGWGCINCHPPAEEDDDQ